MYRMFACFTIIKKKVSYIWVLLNKQQAQDEVNALKDEFAKLRLAYL
jgi:hypothetical protein